LGKKIPEAEKSLDLTREALTMNSYLCLGNAQGLVLKKAQLLNLQYLILAKISKQSSIFFEKAFEAS